MKNPWLIALAFVAILAGVALWGAQVPPGYAYKGDMAETAAATLAALIVVTLVVERGMTVVNAILYGGVQRDADAERRNAVPGGAAKLTGILANKERLRLLGAFLGGLFISAAGVRTLEDLLVTANIPRNSFLTPVDIVLTAALIAGGSNGLSFLLQLVKDRMLTAPAAVPAAPVVAAAEDDGGPEAAAAIAAATDPYFTARQTSTG